MAKRIALDQLPKKLRDCYRDKHWGIEGSKVIHVNDSRLPDFLCEMGELLEFGMTEGNQEYRLDFSTMGRCSLSFDLFRSQTLYCTLTAKAKRELKRLYGDSSFFPPMSLNALCKEIGGRQARYKCPRVTVTPLGSANDVLYRTTKKGDGTSVYHHTFGEEGGICPYLGVAKDGTLWFAGGSYTVPDGGITN